MTAEAAELFERIVARCPSRIANSTVRDGTWDAPWELVKELEREGMILVTGTLLSENNGTTVRDAWSLMPLKDGHVYHYHDPLPVA